MGYMIWYGPTKIWVFKWKFAQTSKRPPLKPPKSSETLCTIQNTKSTFKTLSNLVILSKTPCNPQKPLKPSKILKHSWFWGIKRQNLNIYMLRLFINLSSEIVYKKFHRISTNIVAMTAILVIFTFWIFIFWPQLATKISIIN